MSDSEFPIPASILQRALQELPEHVDGAALIRAERLRQVEGEGFSADHDDHHSNCELADAAQCYLHAAVELQRWKVAPSVNDLGETWPWAGPEWNPSTTPLWNLVKAGALVAAEIDRQLRALRAAAPASNPQPEEPTDQTGTNPHAE